MREDRWRLRPSLGRFPGVLWPVPGDGASDNITIHYWGLLDLLVGTLETLSADSNLQIRTQFQ